MGCDAVLLGTEIPTVRRSTLLPSLRYLKQRSTDANVSSEIFGISHTTSCCTLDDRAIFSNIISLHYDRQSFRLPYVSVNANNGKVCFSPKFPRGVIMCLGRWNNTWLVADSTTMNNCKRLFANSWKFKSPKDASFAFFWDFTPPSHCFKLNMWN